LPNLSEREKLQYPRHKRSVFKEDSESEELEKTTIEGREEDSSKYDENGDCDQKPERKFDLASILLFFSLQTLHVNVRFFKLLTVVVVH